MVAITKNYILKFVNSYDNLYYSRDHHFCGVVITKATWLTFQQAFNMKSYLRKHFNLYTEIHTRE